MFQGAFPKDISLVLPSWKANILSPTCFLSQGFLCKNYRKAKQSKNIVLFCIARGRASMDKKGVPYFHIPAICKTFFLNYISLNLLSMSIENCLIFSVKQTRASKRGCIKHNSKDEFKFSFSKCCVRSFGFLIDD